MGRSISDRMSYRNHYMCSGEATSENKVNIARYNNCPALISKKATTHSETNIFHLLMVLKIDEV